MCNCSVKSGVKKKQPLHGKVVFVWYYGIINRREKSINIDGVSVLKPGFGRLAN